MNIFCATRGHLIDSADSVYFCHRCGRRIWQGDKVQRAYGPGWLDLPLAERDRQIKESMDATLQGRDHR